jgi:hypothetical protein
VAVTRVDVSATEVRRRAAAGETIRYLVPDAVRALVERRGLYRELPRCEAKGTSMLKTIVQALFGTRHQRELKRLAPIIEQINESSSGCRAFRTTSCAGRPSAFAPRSAMPSPRWRRAGGAARGEARDARRRRARGIAQRIGEAEERRKEALEGILDEILPKRSPP